MGIGSYSARGTASGSDSETSSGADHAWASSGAHDMNPKRWYVVKKIAAVVERLLSTEPVVKWG